MIRQSILCCVLLLGWGCKRTELCYDHPHGGVELSVVWDKIPENMQNTLPESVRISLYEASEGTVKPAVYTYYRETYGGRFDIPDMTYDYLVFNADTEMITLEGMDRIETAEAMLTERTRAPYTRQGSNTTIDYAPQSRANTATRSMPLIREPDRFFATCTGRAIVTIGQTQSVQKVEVHPESRIMAVNMNIPVAGLGGARSCRASLSGVARCIKLGAFECGEETGTVIFDMDMSDNTNLSQTVCMFGLNRSPEGTPDEECIQHLLQLEFLMKDNTVVTHEFDLKGQIDFDNLGPEIEIPIQIDTPVELPEVQGPDSGFDASIDGWGEQEDIYL